MKIFFQLLKDTIGRIEDKIWQEEVIYKQRMSSGLCDKTDNKFICEYQLFISLSDVVLRHSTIRKKQQNGNIVSTCDHDQLIHIFQYFLPNQFQQVSHLLQR